MIRDLPRFWLGLLLTMVAGWVAAAGFLEFGGLYVSFMTGNTVQIGLGAAALDPQAWRRPLTAITAFVSGSAAGSALSARTSRWTEVLLLGLEAAALVGATVLFHHVQEPNLAIVALLAGAMGLQNQVVSKHRSDNAGTTFVTGTLFRLGDAIGRGLAGGPNPVAWWLFLAVSVAFGLGATAGAFAALRMPAFAFAVPAAVVAGLTVAAALRLRGRGLDHA